MVVRGGSVGERRSSVWCCCHEDGRALTACSRKNVVFVRKLVEKKAEAETTTWEDAADVVGNEPDKK